MPSPNLGPPKPIVIVISAYVMTSLNPCSSVLTPLTNRKLGLRQKKKKLLIFSSYESSPFHQPSSLIITRNKMSFVRAFSFLTVVSVVTYTILSVATSLSGGSPATQTGNETHQIPSFGLGTWLAKKGDVSPIRGS